MSSSPFSGWLTPRWKNWDPRWFPMNLWSNKLRKPTEIAKHHDIDINILGLNDMTKRSHGNWCFTFACLLESFWLDLFLQFTSCDFFAPRYLLDNFPEGETQQIDTSRTLLLLGKCQLDPPTGAKRQAPPIDFTMDLTVKPETQTSNTKNYATIQNVQKTKTTDMFGPFFSWRHELQCVQNCQIEILNSPLPGAGVSWVQPLWECGKISERRSWETSSTESTLWLFNSLPWEMAHRNRWFTY